MKKIVIAAFTILVLSSLILSIVPNVIAAKAGYQMYTYQATVTPTMDGRWTDGAEWADAYQGVISANAIFRVKYTVVMGDPFVVYEHYLVEIFNDNTNDAGDYWQLCYDPTAQGGSAPQTDDIKIDYVGHVGSGLAVYKGNGAGWASTAFSTPGSVWVVDSISASPLNSNPHWILEMRVDKMAWGLNIDNLIRVAVYDASNAAAGVHSWPLSSADVPNDYGMNTAVLEPIPEGLGFGVIVLLSTTAVLVGSLYFRKHSKTLRLKSLI